MSTDLDFDKLLKTVEKLVRRRYYAHSECEDLLQEARLSAWKAWESGLRDWDTLLNKATNRARSLVSGHGQPTGKPEKSNDFARTQQGDATRNKIRMFVDQYIDLHDRKPTQSEIARGIGMTPTAVRLQIDKLYAPVTEGDDVRVQNLDFYDMNNGDSDLDMYVQQESFEDSVLERMVVAEGMASLREKERRALYLRFWEDKPFPAIAKAFGASNQQTGANWVNKGVAEMRTILEIT